LIQTEENGVRLVDPCQAQKLPLPIRSQEISVPKRSML
jgi:hypothetical protein